MKVIIVGGVAGGASCAARLRRLDETIFMAMWATANPRARHTGFHRADGPIRRAGPRHAETADRLPGLAGTL